MTKRSANTLFLTTSLVLLALSSSAADWPQWRGPNRQDHSPDTGLLKQWPADGPKQAWVFNDAGLGYSGYSIVGGKLYTMGLRGDTEFLICVDTKNGKQLWATAVGALLKNNWGDGPRGTPAVDGNRVYALSGQGFLLCADASTGKEQWKVAMRDFGGKTPGWGFTESVLVDGNKVICTPGGGQGTLLALDKATGKKIWQTAGWTDGAHYSSCIAADHNGVRQLIQLTSQNVAGVDANTGKLLWKSEWPGKTAVIPTPIFKDGHVYVTSGYNVGCKLVKIGAGNAVTEVYMNQNMINHHGGVVLVGGHLYGHSDRGGWTCQDFKTGAVVWSADRSKLGKGAVHYADGMLYCVEEASGTVALVEASPKGWNEKGRFKLTPQTTQRSPQGRIWTHPVVVDGKLYLRDQELLHCYDVKGAMSQRAGNGTNTAE
jgi:outer membrane protein assembly factor BamB